MSEQSKYRAIGYKTEQVEGSIRHKVWIRGRLRENEVKNADQHFYHEAEETLSHDFETELWFSGSVPPWILLPAMAS